VEIAPTGQYKRNATVIDEFLQPQPVNSKLITKALEINSISIIN
jgi:hypothetical protein